jgi:hypothetical protein
MAEYQDRSGFNVGITGGAGGSEPPDTIEAQWIRKLERDLWVRFWGPGVACSDWTGTGETEYDRATGWNQSAGHDAGTAPGTGTSSAGMGDLSGNPDSHISAGSGISTSDPRDAFGYGKYTVRANITLATKGTTCTVTCVGHGLLHDFSSTTPHDDSTLSVPNKIQIVGVPATSMHQLNCDNVNNQFFYAKVIDNDTLELYTDAGFTTKYDSSNNTVWAGSIGYVNFVVDFVEGVGDAGSYETTTTIARDQYIALQERINAAIKRTGQSTQATGTNVGTMGVLPLIQTKAMYKSDGSTLASSLNEDTGRVRADHVNAMSDEIERIGGGGSGGDSTPPNTNTTSLGHFNFHKLLVNGIYAPYSMNNHDLSVYSENIDQASGSFSNNWGSDTWSSSGQSAPPYNIPWSDNGGSEYGNDRPFLEARMTFNDWDHMRYWFNQGGCCAFHPDYAAAGANPPPGTNPSAAWGSWMWQNLAKANNGPAPAAAKVFIGQLNPYHENASLISSGQVTFHQGGYNIGWGVTADAPRVHAIGDQANAYFAGTGADSTDGITITGLSTTNMAQGDILHLGVWLGEIETIDSASAVTLYRIIRQINGTEYNPDPTTNDPPGDGPLSNQAWACSKWYRACQYDGNAGLYGDNTPFPNDETWPAPRSSGDPYIHFDWRFVKDPSQTNKPCIFYRMMYDNASVNATVHGTGTMRMGSRWPDTVGYFYPEQGNPVVTKDNASSAENHDGFNRI